MEDVPAEFQQIIGGMNHYWGDQPFTAGPVYVGAFVFFLFLLGVFIVRGPLKWALLAGTGTLYCAGVGSQHDVAHRPLHRLHATVQ